MDKQIKISETDKIFATGVFLQPVNCVINGKQQWRWIAVGFEDDSFFDGERIDIYGYADNLEDLIAENEE
ncbi:MAG: hypothetical protein ACR2F2_06670 [Pyrinomonadaceae bacterium]